MSGVIVLKQAGQENNEGRRISSGVDEENLTTNDNRMSSTGRRSQNNRVEFTRLLGSRRIFSYKINFHRLRSSTPMGLNVFD